VNQKGEEKKFSFLNLSNLSNQAANILLKYGINKGDRVLVLLASIPKWWIFTLALIKLGAPPSRSLCRIPRQYRREQENFGKRQVLHRR
jgi:acyl-coenzyme A synthetase/AMP-(fatty) acid ligase